MGIVVPVITTTISSTKKQKTATAAIHIEVPEDPEILEARNLQTNNQ